MIIMAIDPNSPLGYALTIIITGFVIWWALLKNNALKNPVKRDQYPLDTISNVDDTACPECGSGNVSYDITMEPILIKCKDCDHKWIYVPKGIR